MRATRAEPLPFARHPAPPVDHYSTVTDHRQRRYLRDLLRRWFPVRRPVQHDFACGTGRAIQLLHGLVHAAHGYDFSDVMLSRARELGVAASLHLVTPTGPVPHVANEQRPLIVTCARFLATVEPAIRDLAVRFAAHALPHPHSGLFVVELERRSHRKREAAIDPLSPRDFHALLAKHGFVVIEQRGFGVLTPAWYRWPVVRYLASAVDALAAVLPLTRWCTTVLYVAQRQPHPDDDTRMG